jgi:hypothetical protein
MGPEVDTVLATTCSQAMSTPNSTYHSFAAPQQLVCGKPSTLAEVPIDIQTAIDDYAQASQLELLLYLRSGNSDGPRDECRVTLAYTSDGQQREILQLTVELFSLSSSRYYRASSSPRISVSSGSHLILPNYGDYPTA